jgi:hypothetical protein
VPKLNQVIAIEKGVKSRVNSETTEVYKKVQKAELFNGFSKTYQPKEDDGETLPPEAQRVQERVEDLLKQTAKDKTELFDVSAQRDYANMEARADVVVDGQKLIEGAPVPFLLALEKELTDLRTLISKLPVLDPAETWEQDINSGLYRTPETSRNRTAKVQKALVLYPATDKHPAQTQMVTEDVTVGYWKTVKLSGAMPRPRQQQLAERVEKLLNAVKYAREEANQFEAPKREVGAALFNYLLG